jgi:hypothetical protein
MENTLNPDAVRVRPARPFEASYRWIGRKTFDCAAWILFGKDPLQTVIDLGLAGDCRDEDA